MKTRKLVKELKQGIEEINAHHARKITLRSHVIEKKSRPTINPEGIKKIREQFNMSRNVFALKLRVSARTFEKWEQGITIPNDQAAALLLMVNKYPDTLQRLESV